MMIKQILALLACSAVGAFGCGDDKGGAGGGGGGSTAGGNGRVQVFVQAEDTIPDGLTPGTEGDNIHDGWTVEYDRFLIAFGNFHASQSAKPSARISDAKSYVINMKALPTGGLVIADLEAEAARWDRVGFDLPNAAAGMEKAAGTSQADYDFMVTNGYSLFFEGRMTKPDGQSCLPTRPTDCRPAPTITFKWGLKAGTSFDDCSAVMGDSGFAIPSGGAVQVKPTVHGDHWFFSNLTQGAEITKRLAQWIANADLDRNGETTLDELRMSRASDLFPADAYNLSGALVPINTGYDFLEAQARTLGDYQGDGECPTRRVLP